MWPPARPFPIAALDCALKPLSGSSRAFSNRSRLVRNFAKLSQNTRGSSICLATDLASSAHRPFLRCASSSYLRPELGPARSRNPPRKCTRGNRSRRRRMGNTNHTSTITCIWPWAKQRASRSLRTKRAPSARVIGPVCATAEGCRPPLIFGTPKSCGYTISSSIINRPIWTLSTTATSIGFSSSSPTITGSPWGRSPSQRNSFSRTGRERGQRQAATHVNSARAFLTGRSVPDC
jgi:hypothetical protein